MNATIEKTQQYVLGCYGRFPVSLVQGEGVRVWDEDGKEYLDFGSGIAVCSLGHSPKCIQQALQSQSKQLLHVSNLYHIPQQSELAEFIVETVMGIPGKVFFCNSGAEANDGAVKLARKYFYDKNNGSNHQHEVITCRNSFHGRTLGGIASTGQDKVKIGFDPLLPGFTHVPFNDCEALREAVTDKTAAILFEPIQGEGGITPATAEFIKTADELRKQHGLLLMFDEVQCGFGRTGDWCAWRSLVKGTQAEGIEPDVVTWAKGMGGGFPIGSFWANDQCATALGPGTHGSTFGGTPLASSVALAVLNEIKDAGCMQKIPELEESIRTRVANWEYPQIETIRGKGLMLGFVLNTNQFNDVEGPASIFMVKKLMDAGLLTVPSGTDVVRWLPPLNVTRDEIDAAFDLMESVLNEF